MPRDPMRALDDVPGPDLWDEITARAAGGDVPVDRPRGHRPLLAVAAVVLVLAAVAGGLVLAARGGDPSPAVDRQVDEQLTAIWGREWDLFGLVVDGERTGVPPIGTGTDGARPAGSAVYLDLTTEGRVGFTGCNGGGTQAELVDGRLVADDDWLSEAADCSDDGGGDFSGFGDDLMALDETMAELIQADPEVLLVGNQLTLTAGDTSARFFDPAARPPAPGEGDELVPSRRSDCVVGISGGPDRGWSLTPGGPLSPDDRWLDDSTGVRSGLWEVTDGEQTAEIQVPGQPVIDLVGERVAEVVLDDWGPATVWFRGDSVQVRAFPGRDDSGPCDAFTVTVAGPDETANRVFAVAVADQVLAAARSVAAPTTDQQITERCPELVQPPLTGAADALPSVDQVRPERVNDVFNQRETQLRTTYDAVEVSVVSRDGEAWRLGADGQPEVVPSDGSQLLLVVSSSADCPPAPTYYNGVPLVFEYQEN